MKRDRNQPLSLQEIKRVKTFFSKAESTFSGRMNQTTQRQIKEFAAAHKYLLIKSLKVLYSLSALSVARHQQKANRKASSKITFTPAEVKPLQKGGRPLSSYIEDTSSLDAELAPERVRGWKLKESVLAKNQLDGLKKSASSPRKHDIVPVIESDPFQEDLDQAEAWRSMIQPHEERQFRISRITEILSK